MNNSKPHLLIFGGNSTVAQALATQVSTDFSISFAARNIDSLDKESAFQIDLNNPETINLAFSSAVELHGPVHAVVNCIGSILLKPAHLLSDKDWMETLNINLNSSFYITRAAAKSMLKTGGSVVLLSTAASLIGLPNHEAIAAAKAGINGLMLSAAATYAANNIRFNCVAPGLVDTKLSSNIINNPKALDFSLKLHPLNRVGTADDIASMIAFLINPKNSWITGQVFAVDGGLSQLKTLR